MARLQILELPEGSSDERPPFVLVIDQAPRDEAGFDALRRDLGTPDDLVERIGARTVLVFEETIGIPANEVTISDAADGNVVRLGIECCGHLKRAAEMDGQISRVRQAIKERRTEVAEYEAENKPSAWSDAVAVTCDRISDALRVFPPPALVYEPAEPSEANRA